MDISSRAEIRSGVFMPVHEEKVPDQTSKINQMEKKMIIDAYDRYGSSYRVAEALGISQSTAYRKIKKYVKKT